MFVVTLAACAGSGDDDDNPTLVTTREDLCAGAAPVYDSHGEQYATAIACPFVQQAENIAKYGQALPKDTAMYDADGAVVANVTHTCDTWVLGTDVRGITVVIDRGKGRIISHGTLHAGQEMSSVHTPMALPADIRAGQATP